MFSAIGGFVQRDGYAGYSCEVEDASTPSRPTARSAALMPIPAPTSAGGARSHFSMRLTAGLATPQLLPKSPLRRATTYAINQRDFFRRCFDDGRFEIDNGRVERRIRMFAVARRNFLFTSSPGRGERLAAAFTLADSCLLLGVEPHRYLTDVIDKLENSWPLSRLSELVPHRWAAEQAAK